MKKNAVSVKRKPQRPLGLKIICVIGAVWYSIYYVIFGIVSLIALPLVPMVPEFIQLIANLLSLGYILQGAVFLVLLYLLYQMKRKGWIVFMILQFILIAFEVFSIIVKLLAAILAAIDIEAGFAFSLIYVSFRILAFAYLWWKRDIFKK